MKTDNWLIINKNGVVACRKTKPKLNWNEIACKLQIEVPNALFERPTIDATLTIKDVPNTANNADIIVNTARLIEQQTGAKINFTVVQEPKKEEQ